MSKASGPPMGGLRRAAGALLASALVALAVPAGAAPPRHEQTKQELKRTQRQVQALQADLGDARAHAEQVQAELTAITTQISQVTTQIEGLQAAIDETERGIEEATREVRRLQTRLDQRARSAYIEGPAGALALIFEADSLSDLSDRLTFIDILSRDDADLTAGIQTEKRRLIDQEANLDEYKDKEIELRKSLQGQQAVLLDKQAEAQAAQLAYAEKLDEAKSLAQQLGKTYERQLAAYVARQAALSSPASPGGAPVSEDGTNVGPVPGADGPLYACPVDAPRSYIDDFGAPRVGHTHQGNDIFAEYGTPIRAPFSGTAEEGSDGLGGNVVHVYSDSGSDYVYNAHLSDFAGVDGAHVEPGDLIGFVGDSGNAAGTPPHDHFEYHPGGGSAVSPYVYLNEVCGVGGSGA
jgi:peptidoglycan LD-endopeptidase LytH